jgi:hypothetical protein
MPQSTLYGPVGLEQIFVERLTGVNAEGRWEIIQEFGRLHNETQAALDAALVFRTTLSKERVYLPGAAGSLQPLDDKGNPMPVQPGGYMDVAYPIRGGGTARANNRVTRVKLSPEELSRFLVDFATRDNTWRRTHMLAALYTNTAWTFSDPEEGNLTIQPLAITSDGIVYPKADGTLSTDQHYLAQAAGIANATDPYPIIYDELAEHPSNNVSPSNPVVALIPSNLKATTQALSAFNSVAPWFVRPGANTDVVTAPDAPGPGTLIGVHDSNVLIKEVPWLPSDYIIAFAVGAGPALAMREYPEPELQGIITERASPDGNREDYRLIRYAGYGVRNRVAAVVYRIGNASYAIPSGYTAPLIA